MRRTFTVCLLQFLLLMTLPLGALAQADTYKAQCSSCHGADGAGSPAGRRLGVPNLGSKQVQSLSDEELFQTIANGVGHKRYPHAFIHRGLTQVQIVDLVGFLRKFTKH